MIKKEQLNTYGFTIVNGFIEQVECSKITRYLDETYKGDSYGVRSILNKAPLLQDLLNIDSIKTLITQTFKQEYLITRSIYFNKSMEKNWLVPWHRDKVISVKNRVNLDGFTGNQKREDHWHVHPPKSLLEQKLTLRIHLDKCTVNNGALHVIPTSHKDENISDDFKTDRPTKIIEMKQGDCLIFRPLLLHSSRKSCIEKPRRVIHLEFSPQGQNEAVDYYENY